MSEATDKIVKSLKELPEGSPFLVLSHIIIKLFICIYEKLEEIEEKLYEMGQS